MVVASLLNLIFLRKILARKPATIFIRDRWGILKQTQWLTFWLQAELDLLEGTFAKG
jgi:hypothetical protein